jgi:membrane protein required for colicin V production
MMNTADAAIFIFWLVCLVRGLRRGPVTELVSIVGVWVGMFAAADAYGIFSRILPGWMGSIQRRYLIGFLILFVCIYILMNAIGLIVAYLLQCHRAGWINRATGAGFGALKGVLVIAVIWVSVVAFVPQDTAWIDNSAILPYENILSEKMARVVPAAIYNRFCSHVDDYKQSWRQAAPPSPVQ